jgi:hypothetical protein|tara:strand:+ start:6423 stop:6779 length:357 start_codon:yes stop_codon:yes gene_type:complete
MNNDLNEYSFEEGLSDGLYIDLNDSSAYKMISKAGMKLPTFITFGLFDSCINAESNLIIEERLSALLTDMFVSIQNSNASSLSFKSLIDDKSLKIDALLQVSVKFGKILLLSLPNEIS